VKKTANNEKSWKCMRKITFTNHGGRLVNLGGVIPDDWSYADIYTLGADRNSITIQMAVVRRVDNGVKHTGKLPRPTKTSTPTL